MGQCVCVCVTFYALFSVVRQKVPEKWILYRTWGLIIFLCLQELMDNLRGRFLEMWRKVKDEKSVRWDSKSESGIKNVPSQATRV